MVNKTTTKLHEKALEYAGYGWQVLPGHTPDPQKDGCSCRKGRDCSSPGKHPRIHSGENHTNATDDEDQIRDWWSRWPDANILVVTGEVSGITVLDVDKKNGGLQSLEELEEEHDSLPVTPVSQTGGGGKHYVFEYADRLDTSTGSIAEGIDTRSDGGVIVAPPSLHVSGEEYFWEIMGGPDVVDPSMVPSWLSKLDENDTSSRTKDSDGEIEVIPEGERNTTLCSLGGTLRRRGLGKEALGRALKGINKAICNPPLELDEVWDISTSLAKYGTEYSGKDGLEKINRARFRPSREAESIITRLKSDGHRLLYVTEQDTWYRYLKENGYWNDLDEEYVKKLIRKHLRSLEINGKKMDRNRKITEVIEALRHETIHPENEEKFDSGKDRDVEHINFENGVLEWRSGDLKDHDPERYDLIQIPHEYQPDEECPRWIDAMKSWIPDEGTRTFIQEYVGYCLVPDHVHHKFPILYGSGKNGKSTFLDVLQRMFGSENYTNISLNKLSKKARFETAYLKDTLINICQDIDPNYLKETGVIKRIVSNESIRGEYKHGKAFDFFTTARLIFSANELPKARDKSIGWYRRLEIVEFPNQFDPDDEDTDPYLEQKLEEEIPGIINWAIDGLKRLKERGSFHISDEMEESMESYKISNDSVRAFLDDRIHQTGDPDDKLPAQYIYRMYEEYCEEKGLSPVTQPKLGRKFTDIGIERNHTRYLFCDNHDHYECDKDGGGTFQGGKKKRTGYTGVKYER